MKYNNYYDLPVRSFLEILNDNRKIGLLGYGEGEEAETIWNSILEQHKESSIKDDPALLGHYKNYLMAHAKMQSHRTLLDMESGEVEVFPEDYSKAGLKWRDSINERKSILEKSILKHQNTREIFLGEYKAYVELKSEQNASQDTKDFNVKALNKTITSFETFGFNIGDPGTLTCGKFDAIVSLITERKKDE